MPVRAQRHWCALILCLALSACTAFGDPETELAFAEECDGDYHGLTGIPEKALVDQTRKDYQAGNWTALERDFRLFAAGAWVKGLPRTAEYMNYFLDCGSEPVWVNPFWLWTDRGLADAVIDIRYRAIALARAAYHAGQREAHFDFSKTTTVYADSRDMSTALGNFEIGATGTAYIRDDKWVDLVIEYFIEDRYDFHPEKGEVMENNCDVSNGIQEAWLADLADAVDAGGQPYACEFDLYSSWRQGIAGYLYDSAWLDHWSDELVD